MSRVVTIVALLIALDGAEGGEYGHEGAFQTPYEDRHIMWSRIKTVESWTGFFDYSPDTRLVMAKLPTPFSGSSAISGSPQRVDLRTNARRSNLHVPLSHLDIHPHLACQWGFHSFIPSPFIVP